VEPEKPINVVPKIRILLLVDLGVIDTEAPVTAVKDVEVVLKVSVLTA
jgi:hypothetical protein